MRTSIIRGALLGILLLAFASPGIAMAGGHHKKGCSNIGTWFGVVGPGDTTFTGWSVTVTGNSEKMGSNLFEFPVFDPSFADVPDLAGVPPFKFAKRIGSMRGNWKRTGWNTFDYTFTGFAYASDKEPVYIAKISGHVVLFNKCRYQYTTALMEVFLPNMRPFHDEPIAQIPLGEFYGYRAKVDLPY
ncbi:MAG: hypothetical protein KJP08_00045 [Gammaproteobacteria bacterium]|nr:hypothetical protein [Gammaproteobacteria bacterium]MBT8104186.1 hypothetical protein [Gammaproteobacteria bacterium]NNF49602.1 hypothetical protein [Woeseiaceae bacterium]NNK24201.1 hypothetical protein [Woeseiaceae bacterium]NNL64330.1 hypothetical protein [Woeseiaceae bacterium]